jgi:hypothetical protein
VPFALLFFGTINIFFTTKELLEIYSSGFAKKDREKRGRMIFDLFQFSTFTLQRLER